MGNIHRMRRRSLVFGAGLAVVAATGVAVANFQSGGETGKIVVPAALQAPVSYLTSTYHVGTEDALRRLRLQGDISRLGDQLSVQLPDSYAGMWLDQERGGVLVVATTEPDSLTAAVRNHPDHAHIHTHQVRWSLNDLNDTVKRLTGALDAGTVDTGLNEHVIVTVDEVSNKVVVSYDTTPEAAAKIEAASARQAMAAEGERVEVRPMPATGHDLAASIQRPRAQAAGPCHPVMCEPPMRGGVRLDIERRTGDPDDLENGTWGACTNGFNVEATTGPNAGQFYTLTAGHCIADEVQGGEGNHEGPDTSYSMGIQVGRENPNLVLKNEFVDFALMPYVSPGMAQFWTGSQSGQGLNLVKTWCRADQTEAASCESGEIPITGAAQPDEITLGMVVCASGSASEYTGGTNWFPGTRCGRVTNAVTSMILTTVCSRPGDSGGPLYDPETGRGIGILTGSAPSTTGVLGPCGSQGAEVSNYSRLASIMNLANDRDPTAGFEVVDHP